MTQGPFQLDVLWGVAWSALLQAVGLASHKEMVGKVVVNPLTYKIGMLVFWAPPVRKG